MDSILNNIGFSIDVSKLLTYPEYCRAVRKYHGVSFWSRLWAQKIRPKVMPLSDNIIRLSANIARFEHEIAFLNLIIERGEKELAERKEIVVNGSK